MSHKTGDSISRTANGKLSGRCSDEQHTEDQHGTPTVVIETKPIEQANNYVVDYPLDSSPPWYLCFLLGFQHYLTMAGGMIAAPLLVSQTFCFGDDWMATSEIFGTMFFVCGIATFIQTTLGCRLPIVQGASFTFLLAAFSILSLDKWKCPDPLPVNLSTSVTTDGTTSNSTSANIYVDEKGEPIWKSRMREIQGALLIASLIEVLVGFTGLAGLFLKVIGPLTIAPIICLVGISLFKVASHHCESNWWIAILTMALIVVFSRYLEKVELPVWHRKNGAWVRAGIPIFRLFPVFMAICVSWAFCAVLTATNAIPKDPKHWAYQTRTDIRTHVLEASDWFRVPQPFQWGMPTFSVAGVLGMTSVIVVSIVESIGDYYVCAAVSGAPSPPSHAINRGIMLEGIGCILSASFGTGTGLTSFSENIGAISITRVASRRIMLAGSAVMILLGVLGKFGAIFVTIPDPIVGGVFVAIFGVLAAIGASSLQYVDMNSPRNIFIFGLSILSGLSLSFWMKEHPKAINTGFVEFDQIVTVLGQTSMFVGGAVAMFLDNTVPGTEKERGLIAWHRESHTSADTTDSGHDNVNDVTATSLSPIQVYDLPFVMPLIRRWKWTGYLPICPTHKGFRVTWDALRKSGRKSATRSEPSVDDQPTSHIKMSPVNSDATA